MELHTTYPQSWHQRERKGGEEGGQVGGGGEEEEEGKKGSDIKAIIY